MTSRPPLAYSYDGDQFEPPGDAVGWRVRRKLRPGKGARTEPVWTDVGEERAELVVELWAPPEHVRHGVRGSHGAYRLDAIDDEGWVLRGEPAFVYILDAAVTDHDLRLYPDLLADAMSDVGWSRYLESLPLSDGERWRCEGLKSRLRDDQYIDLRNMLVGARPSAAVEILRRALGR
jgi:hypothetical protein